MDYLEYLFAGFAVFWAGLFAYILSLQFRLRALIRDMERLEERLAEYEAEEVERPPEQQSARASAEVTGGGAAPSPASSNPGD